MDAERLPEIIREIYRLVADLEAMFPSRHFTPDGPMVGSIGEALAAYYYGFDELFAASNSTHDGRVGDRLVQVNQSNSKKTDRHQQRASTFARVQIAQGRQLR